LSRQERLLLLASLVRSVLADLGLDHQLANLPTKLSLSPLEAGRIDLYGAGHLM
tara:strand:- start:99 stop:260 length:162 start_codon:yes stop_codon:yes gene_type:complete